MLRVGITGGIGSGKSTVSRVFETLGVPVYYSDLRAKSLMNNNSEIAAKMTALFGDEAYAGGTLNTTFVASRMFADEWLVQQVNSIVHPIVFEDFARWAESCKKEGKRYVILESAILFESGFDRYADYVVNVNAPIEERIARATSRDGSDSEHIRERMSHQISDSERAERSDFTIMNSDHDMVLPRILELHKFFSGDPECCIPCQAEAANPK